MIMITLLFFIISFLLFAAAIHYVMVLKRSKMYPPKTVVRKKIQTLSTFAVVSLLLGVILLYIPAG
ncbi:MAG TPA: hypothetical protein VNM69_13870 [Bacillus sp. (in: firmicutes)]|uniref:hypothetical protein n=1 Tax=Bacillus litorisediminis TaxID=2922713 RepID=UPI001FABAFCE|nr:hypothetical protein [Bacillus litorisediminis]HWO76959.1 hypothetical protein [Bacillus sp. (in: firmicutes)]